MGEERRKALQDLKTVAYRVNSSQNPQSYNITVTPPVNYDIASMKMDLQTLIITLIDQMCEIDERLDFLSEHILD